MAIVKYYAQLQIWRPSVVICIFIIIYSNVVEKNTII